MTAYYATIDSELTRLIEAEAEHAKQAPPYPATKAQTLAEINPPRKTHIHIRGDFLRPGEEVQPHTPAILHPLQVRPGRNASRLDLARWLVDPANPLTARVTMNRVWKNLFGQALVTSIDDFGTRGEKPSHPELLDWLAAEFMTDADCQVADHVMRRSRSRPPSPPFVRGGKWSVKRMIKLIVQSATYRQSSHPRQELLERDPRNTLLARQNRFRVEAEVLRDICSRLRIAHANRRGTKRSSAAAGGSLGVDLCRQRPLGRKHWPRPLSPWFVHVVPAARVLTRC